MNTDKVALVLASSSPRRQELIRYFQLPVTVMVSDVDESVPGGWEPSRIVEELSLRKAGAVAARLAEENPSGGQGSIVVGSDTIVVLDGDVLGKPADRQDACKMLARLQGRTHEVYSGVACIAAGLGLPEGAEDTPRPLGTIGRYRVLPESGSGESGIVAGFTRSLVTFKPLTDAEIQAYVASGEPMDKAGAYGAQGLGAMFVEKIEGDFYSVMGLPVNLLYRMLSLFGVDPLGRFGND